MTRLPMDTKTNPTRPSRRKASSVPAPPPAEVRSDASSGAGDRHGWTEVPADERGDAIVAAMGLGGVDYMFFNSGSEIMFMQEAMAKANALGRPAPKLIMM